ncbi:MAG: TraA family conjugative transfer protein [Parasutterella excrementihominis]
MPGRCLGRTSTGGQEHLDLYAMLKAWSTGTLGKSIALMFLLVGLGVGVIRGSIMGAVGCVAASMALFIGPQIIEQIFTALI